MYPLIDINSVQVSDFSFVIVFNIKGFKDDTKHIWKR